MKKRPYLLIGALILLAVALWLPSVQTFMRDSLIVPLLGVLWFLKIVFESIPQAFVWGFVVLLGLVAAAGGFALRGRAVAAPTRSATRSGGLLGPWARLVFQSTTDDYARWRLAQRIALIAQSVLSDGTPVGLRRYLVAAPDEVPAEVRDYLLAGLSTYTPQRRAFGPFRFFGIDTTDRASGVLALAPERVVAFLEGRVANETVL